MMDEIEALLAWLPKKMITIDKSVPLMVPEMIPDPNNPGKFIKHPRGHKIKDPHGRVAQFRYDVVDAADIYEKPIIHLHKYMDQIAYEPNYKQFADAFCNMRPFLEHLLQEIKKLKGES